MEDGRLVALSVCILKLPRIPLCIVHQVGGVVATVEVLEDTGESLWLFVGEDDSLPGEWMTAGLGATVGGKEGRRAKDTLVGSEETLLGADAEDDYRRGWRASMVW